MDTDMNILSKRQFNEPMDSELKTFWMEKTKRTLRKPQKEQLRPSMIIYIRKHKTRSKTSPEQKFAEILYYFYPSFKPMNKQSEPNPVQTLKCMGARLSRYFHGERGWDIIKGPQYVKCNEVFQGNVCWLKEKRQGCVTSISKNNSNWHGENQWIL